jgi:hypothetical protein
MFEFERLWTLTKDDGWQIIKFYLFLTFDKPKKKYMKKTMKNVN